MRERGYARSGETESTWLCKRNKQQVIRKGPKCRFEHLPQPDAESRGGIIGQPPAPHAPAAWSAQVVFEAATVAASGQTTPYHQPHAH